MLVPMKLKAFVMENSAPNFHGQFIALEPSTLKNLDWSKAMLHLKNGQDLRLAIDEYPLPIPLCLKFVIPFRSRFAVAYAPPRRTRRT